MIISLEISIYLGKEQAGSKDSKENCHFGKLTGGVDNHTSSLLHGDKLRGSEDRVMVNNIDEEYLTPSTFTTSLYTLDLKREPSLNHYLLIASY